MDMTGTLNKLDHAFDIEANIHPSANRLDCYRIWVNDWYLVAQISLEPVSKHLDNSLIYALIRFLLILP
uniref:Uncharacterized protein n=1 Tax=Schistosoma haematobium TaxID=6185 RepID=A0A095C3X9_SCHHA